MRRWLLVLALVLVGCGRPPVTAPTPLPTATPTPTPRATPSPENTPEPASEPMSGAPEPSRGRYKLLVLSDDPEGDHLKEFPSDTPELFLTFALDRVPPDTMVRATWSFAGRGAEFSSSDAQLSDGKGGLFSLVPPPGGWPVGEYTVALYLADERVRTLDFAIFQPEVAAEPTAESPAQLARELTRGLKQDRDKAMALYRWLGENITYDVEAFFSGDYGDCSAEHVLKTRKGVCSGYANLFAAMADEVGLESKVVSGYSKGYSFDRSMTAVNHAWNAVNIDGRWQLLDATWGSGFIDENKKFVRRYDEFWFLTPPDRFLYSHLPEDEEWQLVGQPLSKEEFAARVDVQPRYFEFGLKTESHPFGAVRADQRVEIELSAAGDCVLSAALERDGRRLDEGFTLVEREGRRFFVKAGFPQPGRYNLLIFCLAPGERVGWTALTYEVEVSEGGVSPFPTAYRSFGERGVRLLGPVEDLRRGQKARLALKAPGATRVFAIDGERKVDFHSDRGVFAADLAPQSGKVRVFAGYPDITDNTGLLEYQVR